MRGCVTIAPALLSGRFDAILRQPGGEDQSLSEAEPMESALRAGIAVGVSRGIPVWLNGSIIYKGSA